MKFLSRWSGELLSILRIVAAFMFIQHGTQKLLGFPIEPRSPFELMSLSPGLSGILEVTLGPLLLIGLFTRPVAFVLSGLMAFAYFIAHQPRGPLPLQNRGELAALYSFLFLYIASKGSGVWSLDTLLRRK